jgi:hypothetical protein
MIDRLIHSHKIQLEVDHVHKWMSLETHWEKFTTLTQPVLNLVRVLTLKMSNVPEIGSDFKPVVINSLGVLSSVGMLHGYFARLTGIKTRIIQTWPAWTHWRSIGLLQLI